MHHVTLEVIHEELAELKQYVRELRECVHEDLLKLSPRTEQHIEEARKEIQQGRFYTEKETRTKLGL